MGRGAVGAKTAPTPPGSVRFKRNIKCPPKRYYLFAGSNGQKLLGLGSFLGKKKPSARQKLLFHYNLISEHM